MNGKYSLIISGRAGCEIRETPAGRQVEGVILGRVIDASQVF